MKSTGARSSTELQWLDFKTGNQENNQGDTSYTRSMY